MLSSRAPITRHRTRPRAGLPGLAAGRDAAWALVTSSLRNGAFESLVRVDGRTRTLERWPLPASDLAFGGGNLWILGWNPDLSRASSRPGYLARLDPTTGSVLQSTDLEVDANQLGDLVADGEHVWVKHSATGPITRITP